MNHPIDRRRFLINSLMAAVPSATFCGEGLSEHQSSAAAIPDAAELMATLQQFLWRFQSANGSWISEQYGVLRSGQALTPFVLHALIAADSSYVESAEGLAAMTWIRRHLRGGCLGVADPDVLEYPVFATAFALRCAVAFRGRSAGGSDQSPSDPLSDEIEAMRNFLLGQQFSESRGFRPSNLAYGGWGFGGEHPPGQTGHMDLSHTRWALQAIAEQGADATGYGTKAEVFLRLLQKHPTENRVQSFRGERAMVRPPFDGGFYFSPIVLAANKGRIERVAEGAFFRSYATATCDGLLGLVFAGVATTDARVEAARRWLELHPDWEYPAGIPHDDAEPWGDAVYFYHQLVRAEVYRRMGIGGDWPGQLIKRLAKHVSDDGRVVNRRSPLMKEDDPILCTTLALMAVTEARGALSEGVSG